MKIIFLFTILLAINFSSNADSWIQKADFGGVKRVEAVAFSIGDKGYLGTGQYVSANSYQKDFWEYNPSTNTWTQKADFGGTARWGAVGFSIGTKGYIGTGHDIVDVQKDFWEYDPSTNTWTQKATFPGVARERAVGFGINDKGYLGTGAKSDKFKKDFWEYNPATDTWTQKTDFGGTGRWQAVGFSIGDKGYIGTGYSPFGGSVYKNDFWEYDPSSDSWIQKADVGDSTRIVAVGFSIGEKGYIGTGWNGGKYLTSFWEYDQATGTWTKKAYFGGSGRDEATAFSVNDKGYVGTGSDGVNYLTDLWEYIPDTIGCSTPTGLATTNITSSSAQLNWDAITSATKYKVKWKESSSSTWTTITVTAPTTSTTLTGLTANTKYKWKVKSVCGSGVTSDFSSVVKFTTLLRLGNTTTEETALTVYPNPVITSTTISFSLEQDSYVTMELLDLSGRKMKTLLDANTAAGNHQLQLNRDQLSAGIYFLQVKMNGESEVMKIVVQ